MNISVIGSGYVGLVTGACFAETGVTVSCVDVNEKKIKNLKKGIIPIWEPGLEDLVKRNIAKKRLSFTSSLKDSIQNAEVIFIAVGTPPEEDGSADLKYVLSVAKEIGLHLNHYAVVVTKSTVPVGTSQKVKRSIQNELIKRNLDIPFDVASNPEFLKEGSAIDDFLKPDRIIVGTESDKAQKTLERLYKPFLLNGHPIIFMDITSSELTKYAANAMLATRISFMNDMANLCELVGADINMIRKGIGSDPRIGNKFIYPGAGYGGSCFPKDVKAVIKTAENNGYSLEVLKAVERVNNRQKIIVFQKLARHFEGQLKGKKVAVWGLSFKPNTDDMREAPSLAVIDKLLEAEVQITAYDPVAMPEAKKHYGDNVICYVDNPYDALDNTNALLLMTEWNEFRILNVEEIKKRMKDHVIIDGRNIYDTSELSNNGFSYYAIGK
ncbi:MAG: UDP-glucose/GDP-mannose dehydrogenase family protein [Prevotellaceae bacterium]|jgi:UDPglucose 6-dehydrogenase|nr:UDP-glucose/GDP-mannose dehydrogenase family protein [Prevotellaceae bacterium]